MTAERHILIDLGGTHTRVAWGGAASVIAPSIRVFQNRDFADLDSVLDAFLRDHPGQVDGLCAGVAGPVKAGTAQLTNFDWFIDGQRLKARTGARRVRLINDLQAQGYALDDVPQSALRQIKKGAPATGPRLVLNLGTGCNCAVVHRVASGLFVPAAESGHSTLPHSDGRLRALFDHLRTDHAHLPVESVLSGPGLARLHAWATGRALTPEKVMDEITAGNAPDTLSLFLQVLGAVAGNVALHHLPTEGLYLSGGLAKALAAHLNAPDFWDAFTDRGPYRDIVDAMPVFVITEGGFALRGCHRYLLQSA